MKLLLFLSFISLFVVSIFAAAINGTELDLVKKTINYTTKSNLDVYYHNPVLSNRPVVVHVHGGGWCE
eukprot:jgi/Orpsp1_1/1176170/evm.model.c7180000056636.1